MRVPHRGLGKCTSPAKLPVLQKHSRKKHLELYSYSVTIKNNTAPRASRKGGVHLGMPRASGSVTGCHLETFPETMLRDGRSTWRIPSYSESGPREHSRR